jgi:hypothetical protein
VRTDADDRTRVRDPAIERLLNHAATLAGESAAADVRVDDSA